jgi:hypothetical protein
LLPGDCVKLNLHIATPDLPQSYGKKVEKQGSVALGINGDHIALGVFLPCLENVFQIGGLSASPGTIIDKLALNDPIFCVENSHKS